MSTTAVKGFEAHWNDFDDLANAAVKRFAAELASALISIDDRQEFFLVVDRLAELGDLDFDSVVFLLEDTAAKRGFGHQE